MISFRNFLKDEGGAATIEFLFVVPIITLIFLASIESSYYMVRHVMLERSVDVVVRDLRLGNLDFLKGQSQFAQHDALKELLCTTSILNSKQTCKDSMRIWLQTVSTADFEMKAPPRFCVDRLEPIDPATDPGPSVDEFKLGDGNDIMLMRICLKEEPIFPTSVIGAGLIAGGEEDGSYAIVTTSIFVNEPG
jgi:Flp pilus assembly pilin Flp